MARNINKLPLILIAESHRHAEHWAGEHRVAKCDYRYIGRPEQLHGLKVDELHVLFLPSWYRHPESRMIEEIYNTLKGRSIIK